MSIDPTALRKLVDHALRSRPTLKGNPHCECWRVFAGAADGLDGLFIDRYGPGAVMITYEDTAAEHIGAPGARQAFGAAVLDALAPLGVEAVYAKPFVRDRSRLGGDGPSVLTSEVPAAGSPLPEHLDLTEHGLRLRVRLYDGFSTGIFLDQRSNRKWVRDWCLRTAKSSDRPLRVLNTFAYTCAFGVAAASAHESITTTNIDVSPRYLDWGKQNYEINAIDPKAHYFTRMDTLEFLTLARRKSMRFDLIILNPPTFAAANKRRNIPAWKADRDYPRLIKEACEALEPGGVILASTNCTQLCNPHRFRAVVLEGVGPRRINWLELPPAPEDFAGETGRFVASAFSPALR
ncbi:MAG: class I SAM-dependent rRNA methyltransferase [Phycisphaerales bacterium]